MREEKHLHSLTLLAIWLSLVVTSARADEGMWLYNDLPRELLKERHGFEPTDQWIEHAMRASVRFNSGGSGSFVSSTGLVLTNHHVGADTLFKISTREHNYLEDGFLAKSPSEEQKSPDLELNQLVAIEDVTDRVNQAVRSDMSPADAFAARRAVMAEIESESLKQTGLRSDVVTLYGGGRYHLYRYKKYTDVRLVYAPESDIAFFGGDPDNFEYPRYCLDICLFRVYENDKPAKIEHFFEWSPKGAADGELVFVSGHPGRTSRLFTVAALEFLRDVALPFRLAELRRHEIVLQQYGLDSPEATRRAKDELFSVQNSRKALSGMLRGLQDPRLVADKLAREEALRSQVAADAKLKSGREAWDQIAAAQQAHRELFIERQMLERGLAFRSQLFEIARTLVRMAEEDQKPNAERLREFRDSARESLEQQLFSTAPIYSDLEIANLADSLSNLAEELSGNHPLVETVLTGKSPQDRAVELVSGSGLADVAERKRLATGGPAVLAKSTDPMIALARAVDPQARAVRKRFEAEIEEVERQAYAEITKAIFATSGTAAYPDATFTLRLAFGTVSGFVEDGKQLPPWTTIGGAFDHEKTHNAQPPWKLPSSWHKARGRLKLDTPFNVVCTADIIGGNSGSPVFNRQGQFVGIIFDGNIQSLSADYIYTDELARAIYVNSGAILESLREIYGAGELAGELGR